MCSNTEVRIMYRIKVKIADDYAVAMVILIGVEFVSSFALSICLRNPLGKTQGHACQYGTML